jgi:S-DNA-T family DNA segregation ATPase FtsK/SpoIIIE
MSIYASYTMEQIEELFSNYLISSWSYSKISAFARNEKAFEMVHIFNERSKSSISSIAGNAYHAALDLYFASKKEGKELQLPELEQTVFDFIDGVAANSWKVGKKNPTVEECQAEATKNAVALLRNFFAEKAVYEDEIAEILYIEQYMDAFITVNGVDIPLPCHGKMDLLARLKSGKVAIIDHKSKTAFSSEEEMALAGGRQAITYDILVKSIFDITADEVWFVENKISKNKDGSPQLVKFQIPLDENTRRLYEALLYEPLRRMLQAVSDPDYVYLINDSDNFIDKAQVYDFWAKTMISEIEDFNVPEAKRELVGKRLRKIRDASAGTISPKVIQQFKQNAASFIQYDLSFTNMTTEEKIEHGLRTFGATVRVAYKFEGFSSNTYLLEVSAGVKLSIIHQHKLDLANMLDVSSVRIPQELYVHEGKSYIAVEFAKKRSGVLEWNLSHMKGLKIPLGMDNFGNVVYWDLENHASPHVLVCGATGSGKSVFLVSTAEYFKAGRFGEVVVLDPKYDPSFAPYRPYNTIEEIEEQVNFMVLEMEERVRKNKFKLTLVIFDEFADAYANARSGVELNIYEEVQVGTYANGTPKMKREKVGVRKSLEENIRLLLQKGRSVGFRIIQACQRASTKIISGDSKANLPVQICFRVPKQVDSKVVLDEVGAEGLTGYGDGLLRSPDYMDIVRFQGYYKASSASAKKPFIETIEIED